MTAGADIIKTIMLLEASKPCLYTQFRETEQLTEADWLHFKIAIVPVYP